MDQSLYDKVLELYIPLWLGKFNDAEAKLKEFYNKRHPLFDLLVCENYTGRALICDGKEEYKVASKYLTETIKNTTNVWRARRGSLKTYLSQVGAKVDIDPDDDSKDSSMEGDLIKNVSNALWARAIFAELQLMYSVVQFRQQKYVQGVFDFRRSWKTFEEMDNILEQLSVHSATIPYYHEIRASIDMGVGIFNFLCSAVPRAFLFIVEGIGFKANREVALKCLNRAMNTDQSFRCHLATILLSWIYSFFYFNFEKGKELATLGLQRIPDNGYCLFTMAYILRKEGLIPQAITKFEEVMAVMTDSDDLKIKLQYELGNSYYMLGEWASALPLIENYVNVSKSQAFKAFGMYQTAYCYRMLNDSAKEAEYMKKIAPVVRKNLPYDEYALRLSDKYFKKKYTEYDAAFHQCFILPECSGYQKMVDLCENKLPSLEKDINDKLRTLCMRGFALVSMKQYSQAKEPLLAVLQKEKEVKKEKFVLPFSCVGLAEIAVSEGDLKNAQIYIKKAKSYSGYDLEGNFIWRIRRSEEELRSAEKTQN